MCFTFLLPDNLLEALYYEYPSSDGTKKVVVTFKPEVNKNYEIVLPLKESSNPEDSTYRLYKIIVGSFVIFVIKSSCL